MTQETSGPDPLVGMVVANKYRIVALLGEGGMGAVYRAEQQLGTTTRKVALKTLHKHLSHDASIKARFDREAGLVAGLEHPNTIQVFDFGAMDDGTLYLVMEYVEGRSVGDILEKDGPMNPLRVDNILRQVCGSLEEAHGKGIVHRDLKPDNVVLCERAGQKDWVEVLDFGIAKRSSEHDPNEAKLTQQGMVLGTPPYMSPEQFTGQPIDARSDIYALGVMAYEMLTGRLPWQANTAWEWASKHMTEPPTPLEQQPLGPHVPPNQRAAIIRALAKNKEERFGSVKEFYEGFSAKGDVVAAAPAPASAQGRAKTEMGAPMPMMAPTPPGTMATPAAFQSAPAYGPAPAMSGPMGASSAIAPGPMHAPAAKKGPGGLVIGLGALAVLLLVGGGIAAAVGGKKKGATVTTIDLTPTSTTAAPATDAGAADIPVADPGATSVAPLGAVSGAPPLAAGGGGGGGGGATKPVAKADAGIPTPKPQGGVPTPKPVEPPKADPAVCAQYRVMRADPRSRPAMLKSLEDKCRTAGGTP